MLKERKLKHEYVLGGYCYGNCKITGYDGYISGVILDKNIVKEIDDEEYYFAEIKTSACDSDYHAFCYDYYFDGVFLNFNLNEIDTLKYFGEDLSDELFPKSELINYIESLLKENNMISTDDSHDVDIVNGCLKITLQNKKLDTSTLNLCSKILEGIRNYYSNKGVHITRMFGSYVLLKNDDNNKLKAIKATPIPIKYCPLMIKLLKEVSGETAEKLINSLECSNNKNQSELMCELINQVVIKGGYFDTNRPLNSCEANVLFGASETISSAFKSGLLDAAVIVSNNLGTIITTNDTNTQGAVKRMTGLFYTSPSEEITKEADRVGIIQVFPYTATIDQLAGVKEAIRRGYKKIAVTLAAQDNELLEQLKDLENNDVTIYKFGLCSTGINKNTALLMKDNADIVWSCASKYVNEYIEPNAIAQVGVKIPVHIMTKNGWNLVRNHLQFMSRLVDLENVQLCSGDSKPVFLHSDFQIKQLVKKKIKKCNDCPHPCI